MLARFPAEVFHEGVRAVRDQELEPVIALLGEIGGEDVPGIVQRVGSSLHLFDGDFAHAGTTVHDTVDGGKADTGLCRHIVDGYPPHECSQLHAVFCRV